MKKFILSTILLLALIAIAMPTSYADKYDWQDEHYNFRNVKSALVYDLDCTQAQLGSDLAAKSLNGIYQKEASRPSYTVLSLARLNDKISLRKLVDLDELSKTAPEQAATIFKENRGQFINIYIKSHLLIYKIGSYIVPAHTTMEYHDDVDTYTDPNGREYSVTHRYYYPVYVPEHSVSTAEVKMQFEVYDAKTDKLILSREEERLRDDSDDPQGVFGRISSSFFSDLRDKIND